MSLGASGAVGKALVFFNWKGLDVVREYVTPTNPKSDAQLTQRSYVTAAVALVHAAMEAVTHIFGSIDKQAYSLMGSLEVGPRTWFNTVVKHAIEQYMIPKSAAVFRGGGVAETTTQLVLTIYSDAVDAGAVASGYFYYGSAKTAMLQRVAAVPTLGEQKMVGTITGLTNKTKYYMQFVCDSIVGCVGIKSGIYTGTPHV